jgi:hypothetical protein
VRAAYIQLVDKNFQPSGNKVAVLIDWRPDFDETHCKIDVYFREKKNVLRGDMGRYRVGLFNPNGDLDFVLWTEHEVFLGGDYEITCQFFDPVRGMWTSTDTTKETNAAARDILEQLSDIIRLKAKIAGSLKTCRLFKNPPVI